MTGLLLLAVVGLWIWACTAITKAVTRRLRSRRWRWIAAPTLFVVLLVLPVADEVVGGFQFRSLCERDATLQLAMQRPQGKVAQVAVSPSNELVHGTTIPIYRSHIEYREVSSGQLIAQFDEYVAKGGLLVRTLGISESNAPLSLGRPACSGEQGQALPKMLNFHVIN